MVGVAGMGEAHVTGVNPVVRGLQESTGHIRHAEPQFVPNGAYP
jgi:hypothetical protein